MAITKQQFSGFIQQFNFRELFNEMGWDNDKTKQTIHVDHTSFSLEAVAQKSGFKILLCNPPDVKLIPDSNLRKKIETQVTKLFQEHLIIYTDSHKLEQIWQLVVRQAGKPTKVTETRWHISQDPQLLFQRASGIIFEMEEEDTITIVDVTKRMSDNFHQNAEKITKKFYEGFKKEHTAFLHFIVGIEEKANKEWYVSLMLNRLMFCYFIQKKGFLDKNTNYLRDRLLACQAKRGENEFYSFYRNFLLLLFHSGLNGVLQSAEVKAEIGLIPYLNGGLFDEHELEKKYQHIEIDDKAFERLFDFFDQYEWHLDTRINASGKDINPDVIGYIFEKYINDRAQMGAYYTKEDITEYIGKNCIIPFLFDETKRRYPKAFVPDGAIWQIVVQSGDRYIYDAVKKGISEHDFSDLQDGQDYERLWNDLPQEIQIGINPNQTDLVEKRKAWNKPAPIDIALPTEIYRELIDRRKRYYAIKSKIESGEIVNINDFITYNLNIRQFVIDVIENTNDPEFLRHFYIALINMTLLDPTCGSGAFLFAALNILEELYEACLLRMRNFIEDEDRLNYSEKSNFNNKYKYFRDTLAETQNEQHPNQQYFIYKTIILRNLYGVDIMKEAVEIAKLRLFLKLVATVEVDYRKPNMGLEPLPDIDFNIRAGNTLVGFATESELQKGLTYTLDGLIAKPIIEEKCELVAMAFTLYKDIQLGQANDYKDFKEAKESLQKRLVELNHELNVLLHYQASSIPYSKWLENNQPFHWFAEFYEIIKNNRGFDVVIGNPPYVVYSNATFLYKLKDFKTLDCKDLYAFVIERTSIILSAKGSIGMIVPISIISTDGFASLRNLLSKTSDSLWYSSYSMRPAKLFDGVEKHLSIFIANRSGQNQLYSTKYHRWYSEDRDSLFSLIRYTSISLKSIHNDSVPKVSTINETSIIEKIKKNKSISTFTLNSSQYKVYHTRKLRYFLQFLDTAPKIYEEDGSLRVTSELKEICFKSDEERLVANALYLSSLFFWYYISYSDCRNLNKREVVTFPFDMQLISNDFKTQISELTSQLLNELQVNSYFLEAFYKLYGNLKMQVFQPRLSKSIIDEIDTVLALHYGFTEEELDFIINYDIKYRMGKELENGEDE